MAAETINTGGIRVFRKKTHGEVAADELQEGLAHLGVAVSEAGRAAAERLAPRVEAAREAAAPRLDAAREAMAPRMAAAMAAAAPAVASARENLAPRVEAAREAANRAAADLAPRVEAAQKAAQKALKEDVVPRLEAAQTAAVAYATPRVAAARQSLVEGLEAAVSELEARRDEYAAAARAGTKKARKQAEKKRRELEQKADKKRRELTKKAAKTASKVKRKAGLEPEPRRWPWVLAVLAVVAGVVVVLRSRKNEEWTPAATGDGPVPSYREDPVPSSPSNVGKTVSDAETAAGDATPPDTDLGMQTAQMAEGEERGSDTPGGATGSSEGEPPSGSGPA